VLVTHLREGQRATVLQMPAGANAATAEGTVVEPQLKGQESRSGEEDYQTRDAASPKTTIIALDHHTPPSLRIAPHFNLIAAGQAVP